MTQKKGFCVVSAQKIYKNLKENVFHGINDHYFYVLWSQMTNNLVQILEKSIIQISELQTKNC